MKESQHFRLTPNTKERLQLEADRSGVPKTVLVEMALRSFLDGREDDRVRQELERRRFRDQGDTDD